jgi:hypothetical protein
LDDEARVVVVPNHSPAEQDDDESHTRTIASDSPHGNCVGKPNAGTRH